MATKKFDKPAEGEVNQEAAEALAAAQEANEQPKDAWGETTRMIVPRKPRGEDQYYYICVNDRRFEVPANGMEQELPKPVAEILKDALAMEVKAEEYAERIPNYGSEAPAPHPIG